ncbi:hypothetical protein [Flagellimonas flava]|uniref:Lipocalin-like domain-containing protein n=1 Tax=Flagellimonas flava TaxID=570519 RepID=A0A1M5KTU3_9FLAO|nr:hypothetical protein [Allomuricauda flava]SHG56156.1 hypothetical protein SAMN04488116_1772 [Allomuricauda flava]
MHLQLRLLLSFSLVLCINFQTLSQDGNAPTELIKTWYAVKVGEPEGGEMHPTRNKEIFTFNADGTMNIKAENGMEVNAKWEYLKESEALKVTLNLEGNERIVDLAIRDLNGNKLVLVSAQKATEYALSPPDQDADPPRTAPLFVNSDSTIDVANWSGVHPFDHKVTKFSDGGIKSEEAIGVLILLKGNGKNIVRINEDGLTTDIDVSEGEAIDGEMHFNLLSEDPRFHGKIVFRSDNSNYLFLELDKSTVEYMKQ